MGHFHDKRKAIGKNKKDAENRAYSDYLNEMGSRYDIRDIKAVKFIREVPPKKKVTKTWRGETYTDYTNEDDLTAPKSEWMQEWEFEIHSHA